MKYDYKKKIALLLSLMMSVNTFDIPEIISMASAEGANDKDTQNKKEVSYDLNGDGSVNAADLKLINECIGKAVRPSASGNEKLDLYKDDAIDIKDAAVMKNVIGGGKGTLVSSALSDTADIYIENVTCGGGDSVTVNVGIVDWTQDIDAVEFTLEIDERLSDVSVKTFGNIQYFKEKNQIKFYGFMDKKEAYRGRTASLTFSIPEVEKRTSYELSVKNADIYSKDLGKYQTSPVSSYIIADSALKPSGLHAEEINSGSLRLAWNMKNAEKAEGYIIFRDDEEIARTSEMSFTDSGLESGKEYSYTVQAYGDKGYLSPVSAAFAVTPKAAVIENISFAKILGSIGGNSAAVDFVLDRNTSVKKVEAYSVDALGTKTLIHSSGEAVIGTAGFGWDLSSVQTGIYTVQIDITDADGTVITALSDEVSVDRTAPDKVEGFSAFASDECIVLTWGVSSQLNTSGYNIYRKKDGESEFEKLSYANGRETLGYTDRSTENNVSYTYTITAVDCFGQESEMAEPVSASSRDDETPPEVTLFMPSSGSVVSGVLKLTANAKDNVGVGCIEFQYSTDEGKTWETIDSFSGEKAVCDFDTTIFTEQDIYVRVIAYDNAGNASSGLNINSYHVDNKAPEKVTGLKLVEVYDTYATVSWDDVPDKDFSHFVVEYANTVTGRTQKTTVNNKLGVTLTGLDTDTEYTVCVSAVDRTGNVSPVSDTFGFKTISDLHIPEIVSISPSPSAFSSSIPLRVTASDNNSVEKIVIELSTDGENYEQIYEAENEEHTSRFTASYDLELSGYDDGKIYIRAYAVDAEGNSSEENSFIAEYIIDTAKPDKMENVSVNTKQNTIEIIWGNYDNEEIAYFTVYRKNADTDEFDVIAEKVRSLNYFDRDIEPGTEYTYKVTATDIAGNTSEMSDAVLGMIEEDITPPVIENIYPDPSLTLSKANNKVRIFAQDNTGVASIKAEYYCGDEEQEYKPLASGEYSGYYGCLEAVIPDEELTDGNKIHIRTCASDKAGNECEYKYIEYTVDDSKTEITACYLSQEEGTGKITLKWTSNEKDTTLGYYIYRRFNGGAYKPVGSVQKSGGEYEFTDTNIVEAGMCSYKIEAVSSNSNKTYIETEAVEVYQTPTVSLGCEASLERGVEYFFDATGSSDHYGIVSYSINFGDGTSASASSAENAKFVHQYSSCGTYEVVLTCKNAAGLSGSVTKTVEVTERSLIGEVTVSVRTTDGKPAAGIDVYSDVGTPYQRKIHTDSNGKATFRATAGIHDIGVYADGYLPEIKSCTIMAGSDNPVEFSVVEQEIITAQFDVQRMTLDEIKAVGIDVSSAQNQHYISVNVKLRYSLTQDSGGGGTIYCGGGGGNGYNIVSWVPWDINIGGGSSGTKNERKIEPVAVIMDEKEEDVEAVILLDIPYCASYLKEFFDVKLHIINNASGEFSLNDNMITLNIPDGLTLMEIMNSNELVTYIDEIKGQTQTTLEWIIRGDEKGEYTLSADYQGTLSKFDEKVEARFESDKIIVNGNESLVFDMYVPEKITENDMYIKVSATNVTNTEVYNVASVIDDLVSNTYGNISTVSVCPYMYLLNGKPIEPEYLDKGGSAMSFSDLAMGSADAFANDNIGIRILAGGETFSVIYHACGVFTDCKDPETDEWINFHDETLYLAAVEEITGSETAKKLFSLHVVDEDDITVQYDHSNDEENFKKLSGSNSSAYNTIVTGDGLISDNIARELRSASYISDYYEAGDDLLDFLLNFEFDDLKQTDKREYVDSVILDLLASEQMQQQIHDRFSTKLVDDFYGAVAKTIDVISETYSGIDDFKNNAEAMKELITSTKTETAITKFRTGGVNDMASYIVGEFKTNLSGMDFDATFTKAFTDSLEINVGNVIGIVSDMSDSIQDEWNNYINILTMRSVYEEADTLLTSLSSLCFSPDTSSQIVGTEALELRTRLHSNLISDMSLAFFDITSDAAQSLATTVLGNFAGEVISGTAGPLGVLIYAAAGKAYGLVQEDIDNKYLYPAKVVILDSMCNALETDIEKFYEEGDATKTMKYLEYMSKLRIDEASACKTFSYSINNDKINIEYFTTPFLALINHIIINNKDCEDLANEITRIQFYHDSLFIPAISSVDDSSLKGIDFNYAYGRTNIALGSDYEYCINEGAWKDCNGYIYLEPDTTEPLLKVRKKETEETVAGRIVSVRLKRKEYLEGDLSVRYENGYYIFDKMCKADRIEVIFTDSAEPSAADWRRADIYNGEPVKGMKRKYVHVRSAATADTPASQTKTSLVVSEVNVLIGKNSGGKVTGEGHYNIGSRVTVTAEAVSGYRFAGWVLNGKIVSSDKKYSFSVNKDTTIYARFLPESEYVPGLSSNVEKAAVQGTCIDGKGNVYVITTECDDETLVFSHWADANGNIVSYMKTFPFVIDGETELKAVYNKKTV